MKQGRLYRSLLQAGQMSRDRPIFTFVRHGHAPKVYTPQALFETSKSIADRMVEQGLDRRHAPLGLLLRTQEDQTLHYLAALSIGAVPAILTPPNPKLNPGYYASTMSEVLRRSGFAALVSDVDLIENHELRVFQPWSLSPRSTKTESMAPNPTQGEELEASFLQYSSGTTGIKRGVLVRDDAVLAQLRAYGSALRLSEDDCIASWLPLYHDMGFIACLNLPLLHGIPTVVLDPIEWVTRPALLLQAVSKYAATLSWNPNFAYAFMAQRVRDAELGGVNLSSIRALVNCSEPVTHSSQQGFTKRFAPYGLRGNVFHGCYAMAETTFALTHGNPEDPLVLDAEGPSNGARSNAADPYVSVGRALDGVELRIVAEGAKDCEERQIGEVWARSPFNFEGYRGDDEATRSAFADGWYRTGDLGYRVGEALFITGRIKDVLIVGGVNVFPGDLEQVVGEVEGIHAGRAVAFSCFDPRVQTERITILAETETEREEATQALIEVRQRLLAAFQIANFDVQLVAPGWLVKSSSGKMARLENRDKWLNHVTRQTRAKGRGIGASP
jgi:fatty-acyl-CoA synthase